MNMFKKIVSVSLFAALAAGMTPLAAAKKKQKPAASAAARDLLRSVRKDQSMDRARRAAARQRQREETAAVLSRATGVAVRPVHVSAPAGRRISVRSVAKWTAITIGAILIAAAALYFAPEECGECASEVGVGAAVCSVRAAACSTIFSIQQFEAAVAAWIAAHGGAVVAGNVKDFISFVTAWITTNAQSAKALALEVIKYFVGVPETLADCASSLRSSLFSTECTDLVAAAAAAKAAVCGRFWGLNGWTLWNWNYCS